MTNAAANINPDEKLAVMFWIHSGSNYELSGNDYFYGPDFLVEKRVILVTMNYRLGIFGFLSLGTPEYSGNMGLKDQQIALKWVYENIEHFSGDKNRITIFGQSSGINSKRDLLNWVAVSINISVFMHIQQVVWLRICMCYRVNRVNISTMPLHWADHLKIQMHFIFNRIWYHQHINWQMAMAQWKTRQMI